MSEVDEDTGHFGYTMFAAVQDNAIYYGECDKPRADMSIHDVNNLLAQVPDEEIFPRWLPSLDLTKAPETLPPGVFIKRPGLGLYNIFLRNKVVHLIPQQLREEAEALQIIGRGLHSNIVRYHGCHVRRGYITGLVLDRHRQDLRRYIKNGHVIRDKELFMESLESAIQHMHSLGWAHNDLNPNNILMADDGTPILIDFNSAKLIGDKMTTSRGTKGWIDGEMKDYHTSDARHDMSALVKIRSWLDNSLSED